MEGQRRRRKDRKPLNRVAGTPATVPAATGDSSPVGLPRDEPTQAEIARRAYDSPQAARMGRPRMSWLFTRGPESVRLVREENATGGVRLLMLGPGTDVVTHEFADVTECMTRQAAIEQKLLTTGYRLAEPTSDRRSEHGSWRGLDQRRAAS